MASHYHAIVWIDHREAKVFHFNATEVDHMILHPHNPTRHIHHKANAIGGGVRPWTRSSSSRSRRRSPMQRRS